MVQDADEKTGVGKNKKKRGIDLVFSRYLRVGGAGAREYSTGF
jgi:hypothetical protein